MTMRFDSFRCGFESSACSLAEKITRVGGEVVSITGDGDSYTVFFKYSDHDTEAKVFEGIRP